MNYIIRKPIITEKSLKDATNGIFTFAVDNCVNKITIRKEIEKLFKVHVADITTTVMSGKKRIVGRKRIPVYETDWKKAKVTLKKGEKIDLFEIGETK